MNHTDHVNLLRPGVPTPGGVWADFGSGAGAFTLALAELIGPDGEIYSIDRDTSALRTQERALRSQFPQIIVHYQTADFTHPLDLPPLHGMVLANSLHFQRQQEKVIQSIKNYLQPGGRLLIVEYNIEQGNFAVPYPVSYRTWERLAQQAGFVHTELLATRPSRFLRELYSAASW